MNGCTPDCWKPVLCHICGREFTPIGRSVGLEAISGYCDVYEPCDPSQYQEATRRHLWDEHDSNRWYTDREGWAAHVAGCEVCS